MPVAGLIAAAGRSSRMGRPKALLPFGDETFASRLVRVFSEAGLAPVVVTIPEPPDDDAVRASLSGQGARLIPNAWPDLGLGGSIRSALAVVGDVSGLVVCPVDAPFGDEALVRALAAEVAQGAPAAVPIVDGASGHPVAFGRSSFRALERAAEARGARTVLEALGDRVIEVPARDPRIVDDVNTPERYRAVFGVEPS